LPRKIVVELITPREVQQSRLQSPHTIKAKTQAPKLRVQKAFKDLQETVKPFQA
jgi:hypothetical protein